MTLLYPLDAELDSDVRLQLLGTKAAGLSEMTALGIPVPPGFTITTEVGEGYRKTGTWPDGLEVVRAAARPGSHPTAFAVPGFESDNMARLRGQFLDDSTILLG